MVLLATVCAKEALQITKVKLLEVRNLASILKSALNQPLSAHPSIHPPSNDKNFHLREEHCHSVSPGTTKAPEEMINFQ
jgi:hypothetical protein